MAKQDRYKLDPDWNLEKAGLLAKVERLESDVKRLEQELTEARAAFVVATDDMLTQENRLHTYLREQISTEQKNVEAMRSNQCSMCTLWQKMKVDSLLPAVEKELGGNN